MPIVRCDSPDVAATGAAPATEMIGARWLAADRGAFEADPAPVITLMPDAPIPPATATLGEIAAAHDGQPAEAWMRYFARMWR